MSETLETKELKSFFRELEEAITENNRVCNDLEESEERFQESQTLLLALHLKIYSFIRANLNLIEWQAVDDDNFTMLELLIVHNRQYYSESLDAVLEMMILSNIVTDKQVREAQEEVARVQQDE